MIRAELIRDVTETDVATLIADMDDPNQCLGLPDDEFANLVEASILALGTTPSHRLISALRKLYPAYAIRLPLKRRWAWFKMVSDRVDAGRADHSALLPFLIDETSTELVSSAAFDFATLHPPYRDNPMSGPRAVLNLLETGRAECPEGLFLGLLQLADRRVLDLLAPVRSRLSEGQVGRITRGHSGILRAAVVEFLVDWLEEAHADGDRWRFALIASGLSEMPLLAIDPIVRDGVRRLPVDAGEPLVRLLEELGIEDFAARIAPQLLAIADDDPEGPEIQRVLDAWGIDHDAPIN